MPFRPCAGPKRSSIELALLIDVPGRDGGANPSPKGGASVGKGDSERAGVPAPEPLTDGGPDGTWPNPVRWLKVGAESILGGKLEPPTGFDVGCDFMDGGPLTVLSEGPLGGGGVADAAVAVGPLCKNRNYQPLQSKVYRSEKLYLFIDPFLEIRIIIEGILFAKLCFDCGRRCVRVLLAKPAAEPSFFIPGTGIFLG